MKNKKGIMIIEIIFTTLIMSITLIVLFTNIYQYNKLVLENKILQETLIKASDIIEKQYNSDWITLKDVELSKTNYNTQQLKININGYVFITEK